MGWTTCSRPILRPRTASPHWSDWRPRSVPADTACGRPVPPIRDVRQVLGAPRAGTVKVAAPGVDALERSLRPAVSCQMTGMARTDVAADPPGLAVRRIAVDILDGVLRRHRPLDEQLDDRAAHPDFATLAHRDRALVRALVTVVLRRLGTLRHLLGQWLKLPADAPRVETVLLLGAAQILWLDVADHAAVDLAVRLVRADRRAARYAGLVNAVLRRVAREGAQFLAAVDTVALDTPEWLMARWVKNYGAETARAIAVANGAEPALDLTVRNDPEHWASALGGRVLPTGSVRAIVHGPIAQLPGYGEGGRG